MLDTPTFQVEVQVRSVVGKAVWFRNDTQLTSYFEAAMHALDLMRQWSAVEDIRVIPA